MVEGENGRRQVEEKEVVCVVPLTGKPLRVDQDSERTNFPKEKGTPVLIFGKWSKCSGTHCNKRIKFPSYESLFFPSKLKSL